VSDRRAGVVILTHDRPDDLARTLQRLQALPERPRLVVVDNASTPDPTAWLAARFPGVDLVRLERNTGAAGRNAGVVRLDTPYVAFCDDDAWWAAGMIARAADLLDAHPRLALITGQVLVGPGARLDPTCLEMASSPIAGPTGLPGRPVLGFLCAATMVRRHAFLQVGGFEPRLFLGGEEHLLAIDLVTAGFALAYVEDVVVHHHPSSRRQAGRRRQLLLRNALWCAWLRRPVPAALRFTLDLVRARRGDPALLPALAAALAGATWVAQHRRVVPEAVERDLRTLELWAAAAGAARTSPRPPPAMNGTPAALRE
jgi:GT2 family glycosyltransferase